MRVPALPPPFPYLVSDGLKRSPLGHKSGTFGTNKAHSLNPIDRASLSTKHLGTFDAIQLFTKFVMLIKVYWYLTIGLIAKDLNLSASINTLTITNVITIYMVAHTGILHWFLAPYLI